MFNYNFINSRSYDFNAANARDVWGYIWNYYFINREGDSFDLYNVYSCYNGIWSPRACYKYLCRSFKEAQTYLTPLTVIAFIPVYATYMLDGKNIDSYYFNIPLANVVCLMKEFLSGIFNIQHMMITFGWIFVYIIASVLLARYMFSREQVVFRT